MRSRSQSMDRATESMSKQGTVRALEFRVQDQEVQDAHPDGPRPAAACPGLERNMRVGHDTVAGLLRCVRTAVRMWTACGKPGPAFPETAEEV